MTVAQMRTEKTFEELVRDFPWDKTSLGPREIWPAALRFAVELCLTSRMPIMVWWGPDAIQIYNEAYIPILGARHPAGLGQSGAECWPEVWHVIGPMMEHILETGEAFWAEDMPFLLERSGFVEEACFTFSYSRIDDKGLDGQRGILCVTTETTKSVLREREFRAMADTIANIVYTHAADGSVTWANTRWYEYSQLAPELALTRQGWRRVAHAGDREALQAVLARAFGTGEPYETELRLRPAGSDDRAFRWFLLRAVPMRSPDGLILRWAGSATDIHDRRLAEDAIRAQLEHEHEASKAFQQAALPQMLPAIPGLAFNAVYEAAEAQALVGGDWYDAFRLADGRVVVSVGDVIGSGLSAAVTMAGVRQAIRGAAEMLPEPVDILDAADRALRSEQPDRIVTAFVGVLDPLTLDFAYASAGHPAPVVRTPDGTIVMLDTVDVPLGLRGEPRTDPSRTSSITLVDGSLLTLYTDGLTEASRNVLEGERNLRSALASEAVYAAADPAAAIRAAMLSTPSDDVAILTLRIAATEYAAAYPRWKFPADDAHTSMRIRRHIGLLLRGLGATAMEADDAELVFGELLGNVVRHTGGDIEAALDTWGPEPVLHVLDRGPGFTFYARLPNDNLSESGRGLYITMMLAREFSVVPRPDGGSHARAVLATHPLRHAPQG